MRLRHENAIKLPQWRHGIGAISKYAKEENIARNAAQNAFLWQFRYLKTTPMEKI
jgi:hypothetical protein